jgi:hypothetical protein
MSMVSQCRECGCPPRGLAIGVLGKQTIAILERSFPTDSLWLAGEATPITRKSSVGRRNRPSQVR